MTKKPVWWSECEQLKESLGIPDYEPPRFEDGTYTYNIMLELEDRYNCTIQFRGINTEYLDAWEVYVEGEPVISIGRHRDKKGNTVFEMSADNFIKEINNYFN
jgi:hypothetical protein